MGIAGLDEGELASATISKTANGLVSYLGRADYNYKSKYLLTVSFRADGSSKFLKDNRWAYFPSASAAWGFGEEKFVKNVKMCIRDRYWNVRFKATYSRCVSYCN